MLKRSTFFWPCKPLILLAFGKKMKKVLAEERGIEPRSKVLETRVIPLYHSPLFFNIWDFDRHPNKSHFAMLLFGHLVVRS